MESTSVNQYSSLLVPSLQLTHVGRAEFRTHEQPLDREQIYEVLQNIEEINIAKSFHQQSALQEQSDTMQSIRANKASFSEQSSDDIMSYTSQKKKSYDKSKSLIFSYSPFSKSKLSPLNTADFQIKIYFFNLPMFKVVSYQKYSKISDIMTSALISYSEDKAYDQSKIARSTHYQNYQVRLPLRDGQHQADMSVAAISYQRIASQNIFDSLVLLPKPFTEKKGKITSEIIENHNIIKKNEVKILLLNDEGDEIGHFSFGRADLLDQIYEFIWENKLCSSKNFCLQESIYDDFDLPRDFEVKNLSSNKIYVKHKKYYDETEMQEFSRQPIRHMTLSTKENEVIIKMPIGLTEASKYEQFQVFKINTIGISQQRVLGIDQTKIYNYEKQVRKQKKQPSFFRKMFGADSVTGTKRPFRLISDIKTIQRLKAGFKITFLDKKIEYLVKNQQICQKIWRKLTFLINYSKIQHSKSMDKPSFKH